MSKLDDSAFPHGFYSEIGQSGLTKRELFAAMVIQGFEKKNMGSYSGEHLRQGRHEDHARWVAEAAVLYADALIKALSKCTK